MGRTVPSLLRGALGSSIATAWTLLAALPDRHSSPQSEPPQDHVTCKSGWYLNPGEAGASVLWV